MSDTLGSLMNKSPDSVTQWKKLGIIAGTGELPVLIAHACAAEGKEFHITRLGGGVSAELDQYGGDRFEVGELGRRFSALKDAGCDVVTMVGNIARPDFKSLKLDTKGTLLLPKIIGAAAKGDDALLSVIVEELERAGFRVIGAHDVSSALLAPSGQLAGPALSDATMRDIMKGALVASAIGALDIGQGAVICNGLVLAVEAQEGTDEMLRRVERLPQRLRGNESNRLGALVKRPKPKQELRVDLPTIGLETVELAAKAGLQAIGYEAGRSLLLQRAACIETANRLGVSLFGFRADDPGF